VGLHRPAPASWIPATGRIVLSEVGPEFSADAQVSVLVHEPAHALVRSDRREDDPKLGYAEEELVVKQMRRRYRASGGRPTPRAGLGRC
jgi:hypothetical protein